MAGGVFLIGALVLQVIRLVYLTELRFYYSSQSQAYYDAFELIKRIDEKSQKILIVDVRSPQEYASRHIKNAVNIPSYIKNDDIYGSLTSKAERLASLNRVKRHYQEIVVYGFSPQSKLTMDTALTLLRTGKPVRLLNIGFYEWKNNYFQWLTESAWQGFSIDKYLEPKDELPVLQKNAEMLP